MRHGTAQRHIRFVRGKHQGRALLFCRERQEQAGQEGPLKVRLPDGLRLTTTLSLPPLGGDEIAVIEAGPGDIWVSSTETRRDGERLVSVADLVPPASQPFALDRSSVVVTVLGD